MAHIAGIPVEETALSLVPLAAVTGSVAGLKVRERMLRRRAGKRRRRPVPRAQP